MIPIKLKLSGFLSYRDPVEVDFTLFDLGNPTSYLVVFLIMAFVMKRRHLSSSLQA